MSPYKKKNLLSEIYLGVSKKIEKPIKPRKLEKKNRKNRTVKKNRLNRLKFWKNCPVRFWFYKPETKKTKLNPNRKKTEPNWKKTESNWNNRAKPVWTGFCPKNPTRTKSKSIGLNRFRFGFGFFKKNLVWLLFFYKNRTENDHL